MELKKFKWYLFLLGIGIAIIFLVCTWLFLNSILKDIYNYKHHIKGSGYIVVFYAIISLLIIVVYFYFITHWQELNEEYGFMSFTSENGEVNQVEKKTIKNALSVVRHADPIRNEINQSVEIESNSNKTYGDFGLYRYPNDRTIENEVNYFGENGSFYVSVEDLENTGFDMEGEGGDWNNDLVFVNEVTDDLNNNIIEDQVNFISGTNPIINNNSVPDVITTDNYFGTPFIDNLNNQENVIDTNDLENNIIDSEPEDVGAVMKSLALGNILNHVDEQEEENDIDDKKLYHFTKGRKNNNKTIFAKKLEIFLDKAANN